jgi:hypothetical protein
MSEALQAEALAKFDKVYSDPANVEKLFEQLRKIEQDSKPKTPEKKRDAGRGMGN